MPLRRRWFEGGILFAKGETRRGAASRYVLKTIQPQIACPGAQHRGAAGQNAFTSDARRGRGVFGQRVENVSPLTALRAGEKVPEGIGIFATRVGEHRRQSGGRRTRFEIEARERSAQRVRCILGKRRA